MRLLPHRYPFLLVDRVLELDDRHALTLKNVTFNEPFFMGHFPGYPVMPGVLIMEALAQSAGVLAMRIAAAERDGDRMLMLTGLDKVRFRRQVIPGDQLKMEVTLLRYRRPLWKIEAVARVEGELVAEGEISAMEVEARLP
ncbi:MAG: 3-hydroxyacyl-ACP dehydratase FabZ [Candidatus Binataceae bacterium]|nr:3-hydroxyacyl-ACP dehydratase FabZ [Candidatus Binataceae bacterium]